MGTQYPGSDAFPSDFTIPDDLDDDMAASFNVAFEALGDRTVYNKARLADYIANHSPRVRILEFLASGSFTTGARDVACFAAGCGGGGGGAKGYGGQGTDDRWIAGAGGGAGSIYYCVPIILLASTTYDVAIGDGGLGATVATGTGGSGGDTILSASAVEIATFGGAQGGRGPVGGVVLSLWNNHAMGGMPRAGANSLTIGSASLGVRYDTSDAMWTISALQLQLALAAGGYGSGGSLHPASCNGQPNPFGKFVGGTAGAFGADLGSSRGGGGGGGGGAGPFGNGGNGGNGHDPITVPGGSAPTAGAANSGAGGGGSGSVAKSGAALVRDGAAGGSGRFRLITVVESP